MCSCRIILSAIALVLLAAAGRASGQEFAWPKVLEGERGKVQIYQPQIESFAGNHLEARAAVSLTMAGEERPVFGAMWFACDLATDTEAGTATLERVRVTNARFPDTEEDKVARLSAYLEQEIPRWDLELSLAALAASLDGVVDSRTDDNLRHDSPEIHVRSQPAVLVLVDGDPVLAQLHDTDLEYVANTMFFIVKDPASRAFYLRGAGMWFTATDVTGPWSPADGVPAGLGEVAARIEQDERERAAAAAEDAEALGVEEDAAEAPPEIVVSTVPAELIVTDGAPDFAPIAGTDLLYLRNTETDVLMDIAGQQYYALVAGRWYRNAQFADGRWQFVDFTDLPADFAAIPADGDMGQVLAAVPGTPEARDAVLDAQIPQTAEVDRKSATCSVTYDGEPTFETCGAGVSYALNTDKSVLLVDGTYYCVDDAVWFVAAGPTGPWRVADAVPAAVQDLPADCPVYNVKYVYIYDSTPDVVYVGYTPGYYGYYVAGPCVVYGTGWYYRPWWGRTYYPRPVTYGFGVHYSPWTGWGFTFGMSYGWLHIGVGWGRPYYGCWGPGGYRYGYRHGYWHGYNHGYRHGYRRGYADGYRAGYKAAQRQPRKNIYRDRTDGVKRTGDVGRPARTRPATSDRRNDVYADRKGDVYRDRDGQWEKREGGDWREDRADRGDRSERDTDRARDRDRGADRSRERDQDRVQPDDRQRDRSRDQARPQQRPQSPDRSQLDRDRGNRQRGADRSRQAPRQAPRRAAPRGGGGRR